MLIIREKEATFEKWHYLCTYFKQIAMCYFAQSQAEYTLDYKL